MIQYYNQISVNHYKREVDGSVTGSFRPVDVGWRFCRDELPEDKLGYYLVMWDTDSYGMAMWNNGKWTAMTHYMNADDITQWFKAPEPLKEE